MITMIGIGIAFLFVLAIGVRVVDAAQAPRRRRLAAERRERWEARAQAATRLPAGAHYAGPPAFRGRTCPSHVPMKGHAMTAAATRHA